MNVAHEKLSNGAVNANKTQTAKPTHCCILLARKKGETTKKSLWLVIGIVLILYLFVYLLDYNRLKDKALTDFSLLVVLIGAIRGLGGIYHCRH